MKVGRKGKREGDWGPRFRALFINYRCLTETNSRYNGLLLMRTVTQGSYSVRYKES